MEFKVSSRSWDYADNNTRFIGTVHRNFAENIWKTLKNGDMDHDLDIKPIAKSRQHLQKWVEAYPFYANVEKEGVKLFEAA